MRRNDALAYRMVHYRTESALIRQGRAPTTAPPLFKSAFPDSRKASPSAGYWYHFSPIASYCSMLWPIQIWAFSMSRIILMRFTEFV